MKKIKRRFLQFAIVSISLVFVAAYRNYDDGTSFLPPEDGIYEYGKKQISPSKCTFKNQMVEKDGWIYYINIYDEESLYKKREEDLSSAGEKIFSHRHIREGLNIVGDWIYFGDRDEIYKIQTDGTGFKKVSNRIASDDMIAVNQVLYFTAYKFGLNYDRYVGLCKVDTETGREMMLTRKYITDFLVDEETIYFVYGKSEEDCGLYKMDANGKNKSTVYEGFHY